MLEEAASPFPGTACVQALEPRVMVSLAAFKGQSGALNQALGVELPRTPWRIVTPDLIYLWSGPDSWLAMGPGASELGQKIGHLAVTTAQSDGLSLFRVSGPFARVILGKLVPIDLHESVFPPDGVALTLAAHIGIRLWREEDGFVLACFRSFAGSLYHALTEAEAFTPKA
jgi:heterotetrameric sarcosine oxidase gamma subunit